MTTKKVGSPLPFLFGIVAALILGWWIFPQVIFSNQDQPFRFSHKAHLEQGLTCSSCHAYRKDGSFAGTPSLQNCATCHYQSITGTPAEKKFVNEYVKNWQEVPWKHYQKQPDNVYFSHIAHKKYECTKCHPSVGHSKDLPTYHENKLTGYSSYTMKMDECERCHAQNNVSNACYICHK